MGIQHLLLFIAHELKLDGYNCQYSSGSPQFVRNRRSIKETYSKLCVIKVSWFFREILSDRISADWNNIIVQMKESLFQQASGFFLGRSFTGVEGSAVFIQGKVLRARKYICFHPRLGTGRCFKEVLQMQKRNWIFIDVTAESIEQNHFTSNQLPRQHHRWSKIQCFKYLRTGSNSQISSNGKRGKGYLGKGGMLDISSISYLRCR